MTDIAIKQQLTNGTQQAPKAYYVTDETRKKVSNHNTGTHFFMGQHSTVHYSQTKMSTMDREGLSRNTAKKGLSSA